MFRVWFDDSKNLHNYAWRLGFTGTIIHITTYGRIPGKPPGSTTTRDWDQRGSQIDTIAAGVSGLHAQEASHYEALSSQIAGIETGGAGSDPFVSELMLDELEKINATLGRQSADDCTDSSLMSLVGSSDCLPTRSDARDAAQVAKDAIQNARDVIGQRVDAVGQAVNSGSEAVRQEIEDGTSAIESAVQAAKDAVVDAVERLGQSLGPVTGGRQFGPGAMPRMGAWQAAAFCLRDTIAGLGTGERTCGGGPLLATIQGVEIRPFGYCEIDADLGMVRTLIGAVLVLSAVGVAWRSIMAGFSYGGGR